MANGSVTIDVTANTKPAEQNIKKFKNNLDSEDVQFDLVDEDALGRYTKQIEYLEIKANDLKETIRQIDLGGDTKGDVFKLEAELERTINQRDRLKLKQAEETNETQKNVNKEKELGVEIEKNRAKQQGLNNATTGHHFSLDGILKKVTRWGLAIIGVRSAYMGIRRAISLVAGSNDAISQKMENMRNVLISAITPVVEFVVNLLMKAMVYVNYITKALFGKAIFNFSKATGIASKNMASTSKSAGSTAKSLKQASKQLAGFDEMNVLTDNKSSSGGGTSGGVGGLDTSKLKNAFEDLEKIKIPDWLDNVAKALKPVVEGWKTFIGAIQEKIRLDKIEKDNEAGRRADNKKRQQSLEKQGTQIIKNSKAQKQMTDQEFIYIRGIEDEIMSLSKKGKLTDAEKERLRILTNRYGDLYREGVLNNSQMEMYRIIVGKTKVSAEEYEQVMKNLTSQSIEEYKATKNEADGLEQVKTAYYNGKQWVNQYGVTLDTLAKKSGLTADQTLKIKKALDEYEKSDKSMDALKKLGKSIDNVGKEAGLSKEQIKELRTNIGNLKSKKIDVTTTITIDNIKEKVKGATNKFFKALFGAKGMVIGYSKGGVIPYARGGIINQPSRGVPLPIGGEHGMEGVVPLTDSQQMALLGEAIGKYITINANITNTMNGRILSRELQKIQNEQSFSSNRW